MKIYSLAIFLFMYAYYMQSAQIALTLDKAAVLQVKLDAVKASSQPEKFLIQPTHKSMACSLLNDANRKMHEDAIRFIHVAFEMIYPDSADSRLLTPRCVIFCMEELQKKPQTPRSSKLVAEFFEIKKPWLQRIKEVEREISEAEKVAKTLEDTGWFIE